MHDAGFPERAKWARALSDHFNSDEMRILFSELSSEDWGNVATVGAIKELQALELVEWFQRRDTVKTLISAIRRARPNIEL